MSMSFDNWQHHAEKAIQDEMARGGFDNLPGAGKPIPGIGRPDGADWWIREKIKREHVDLAPGWLRARKQVEVDLARAMELPSEAAVRGAVAAINRFIREENTRIINGPTANLVEYDEDAIVAKWRLARAG